MNNYCFAKLDAKAFAALVKGETVDIEGRGGMAGGTLGQPFLVRLILADIGYPLMRQLMEAQLVIREPSEPPEACIIPPGEPLDVGERRIDGSYTGTDPWRS
jgi:hypothetical protein